MDYSNAIKYIFEFACPSIIYRTRKEILGETPGTPEMLKLQDKILTDAGVQHMISLQKEDGWLGGRFHGEDEPESGIRYLREKGLQSDNPVIIKALNAIKIRGKDFDEGALGRVGKALDEYHLGGSKTIKACVFAYAGYTEEPFISEQVEEALSAFRYVLDIRTIEDVYKEYKGKLVFKENVRWPSLYHLRLLAYTYEWRNKENRELMTNALKRLLEFSPIPDIKLLYKNQIMAPAAVFMHDFVMDLQQIEDKDWMAWFHRTEMIARLGIAEKVKGIDDQIHTLQNILLENEGLFKKSLSHYYFHRWTSYTGLALENGWKRNEARICDLTFRSLLILKLAGYMKDTGKLL